MTARHLSIGAITAIAVIVASIGFYLASDAAGDHASKAQPQAKAGPQATAAARRPASESGTANTFTLETVATGFNRPTFAGAAPGDPRATWVLEQPGRVVRYAGGRRRTVLDLRRRVSLGAERGLLGMAFHPEFAANRRVFLHYTDPAGNTRVAEYRAPRSARANRRAPRRVLLRQRQPEENHNGGQLAFGPDGRLHLGLGDGGGAFDPHRSGQNPRGRLGKIIATSVRGRPDWEPVVTGLRNPWRFSFDFALGELWIADVGQDRYEEINRILLEPDEPPKNGGWSVYEGVQRVPGARRLNRRGELVWPIAGYSHDEGGCSVTGGHVYRGTAIPALQGRYVYGDFCTGALWTLQPTPKGGATDVRRERAALPQLTHIGVDGSGELVLAAASGGVYRAVPARSASR